MSSCLILPCAGNSQRFGQPKQLVLINGKPLFIHSLLAFSGLVDEIIIPCLDSMRGELESALQQWNIQARLITGGNNRMESVYLGLCNCPDSCDKVLVHDAARPCIDRSIIMACIQQLDEYDVVVTAIPCTDTLKQAFDSKIEKTIDREHIYLAQTPQCFARALALPIYQEAIADGKSYTDDASLFEQRRIPVHLVPGNRRNLKVTYPEDISIASALLAD